MLPAKPKAVAFVAYGDRRIDHHDLSEKPRGSNAFVDDLRRQRRLGERLALGAHPLAADMPLHREQAGS